MGTEKEIQKILNETLIGYMERGTEGWLAFMREELLYTPDPEFLPMIDDIANFRDTAVKSAHGVGKTTVGGNILQTALILVPDVFVMQLSPTWSQVKDVFWNELRRWYSNSRIMQSLFELADKSPRLTSYLNPEVWKAHGIASNSPGKVEGRHSEKRIFKIVDEAKAVEDSIEVATEGAMTAPLSWRLKLSTPSTPGGKFTHFYYCFTRDRELWKCHSIPAWKSVRVSKKWIARMERFGKDSQIYKARVAAEFPDATGDVLIPLQTAEQFYSQDAQPDGLPAIGVDVARFGEDECVITVWKGNVMTRLEPFEHKKTTETGKLAVRIASEEGARAIVVDDIGVGGGVTDYLGDHYENNDQVTIVPFIANSEPMDKNHFVSMIDQVLYEFSEAIKNGQAKSLINDDVLIYQLSSYKKAYTADERITIKWPESRKDRAAEQKSPDRADAAFMGWLGSRLLIAAGIVEKKPEKESKKSEEEDDEDPFRTEFKGIRKREF